MNQLDPFEICLAEFTPRTPQQQEFCAKVENLVQVYTEKFSAFDLGINNIASSVKIADVASKGCRRHGFILWRTGELVAEREGQCLFLDIYPPCAFFTLLDKCPIPRPEDDPHYHLRYEGGEQDKGSSDDWKRFPVGVVLEGLEALLQRFKDDHFFADVNTALDAKLAALQ